MALMASTSSRRTFLQQISAGAAVLVAGCESQASFSGAPDGGSVPDGGLAPDASGVDAGAAPVDAKTGSDAGANADAGSLDAATLPPNEIVLVGSNSMFDLVAATPSRFGAGSTEDGAEFSLGAFGYALHGAYGSGTYVPNFGSAGSYVVVNAGGDKAPCIWDAIVFDFATNNGRCRLMPTG
jgi:hypothetical protein